jgi:hypothetical protein
MSITVHMRTHGKIHITFIGEPNSSTTIALISVEIYRAVVFRSPKPEYCMIAWLDSTIRDEYFLSSENAEHGHEQKQFRVDVGHTSQSILVYVLFFLENGAMSHMVRVGIEKESFLLGWNWEHEMRCSTRWSFTMIGMCSHILSGLFIRSTKYLFLDHLRIPGK